MDPILHRQVSISPHFGVWAEDAAQASQVKDVSAATVQFVVASTNVNDAGSAAGTIVYARLGFTRILDSAKIRLGHSRDTSFSFGTGTALTTLREFDWRLYEDLVNTGTSRADTLAKIAENFANGEYTIDHRVGLIIGKKATTGASDTGSYSYRSSAALGSTGAGVVDSGTVRVTEGSTSMLVRGTEDEIGADTYTTIITPATACTHILIGLKGTNDAIISLDNGVTEHMVVFGGEAVALDGITISAGVAIRAKNKTAGSNYTNLNISVW